MTFDEFCKEAAYEQMQKQADLSDISNYVKGLFGKKKEDHTVRNTILGGLGGTAIGADIGHMIGEGNVRSQVNAIENLFDQNKANLTSGMKSNNSSIAELQKYISEAGSQANPLANNRIKMLEEANLGLTDAFNTLKTNRMNALTDLGAKGNLWQKLVASAKHRPTVATALGLGGAGIVGGLMNS